MGGTTFVAILASLGRHHGEADPTLLQWIMAALSHILLGKLGFTELTVVIIIGIIILAMPAMIVIAYLASNRRVAPRQASQPVDGVEHLSTPE